MTQSQENTNTKKTTPREEAGETFDALSIRRIRSLLEKPDISPSQKRTLLNLLKRLQS